MRRRKIEDDEMLVTHPPAEEKDMGERAESEAAAERQVAPDVLAARLAAATDPEERKRVIHEIQQRLGNQGAERIIRTVAKSGEG